MSETADATTEDPKKKKHHRDPAREVVETIVFVVVLVLLLKLFVTEAFVIPTGSMAETLYGYQTMITCPKCGHVFPVNSHDEVEGRQGDGRRTPLYGFCCPNCRYMGNVTELNPVPQPNTGDRVLVLKPLYHVRGPHRGDVVVFKYPEKPQEKHTAQNYIKRAMGFGGETVAIHRGDLFLTTSLGFPSEPLDGDGPEDLWRPKYMYVNSKQSEDLFAASEAAGFPAGRGGFEIVRKGEEQVLADLRLVWDNDRQPKDLAGKVPPRWYAPDPDKDAWKGDDAQQPRAFAHSGADRHWIRYRHLAMPWKLSFDPRDPVPPTDFTDPRVALEARTPKPVDNFLGYNAGRDLDPTTGRATNRDTTGLDHMWVGDLCLECEAQLDAGAEVTLELSRGVNRFRAVFGNGKVALERIGRGGEQFGTPSRPCKVTAGKYKLRFANIDCRLWVWVDGKRIDFGAEGDYQPAEPSPADGADPEGWVQANDVDAPAGIAARGGVTVRYILLRRDVYYTRGSAAPTETEKARAFHASADAYYVQPGHYMCLGDNSAQSSDSRKWGTVPDRLMLGKAVFVFWPAWPTNRVGFIR